nr:hypothetical protein [Spirochaetota bacterium]
MNSPFVERANYTVDLVVGVKNPPKIKIPVIVKYLVLDVGSKIPEVNEVAYPDKYGYSDIRGSGTVEFTGSKFNLVQIHNLEILKEYDIYFIIENEGFAFPKQLMKRVALKPESPKIISPEILGDKIVFRCYNSNPDASLYVSGDFDGRLLSAGVGIEGRRLKDDDKNRIFEVLFDKSQVKKGDRYLFYYSKNEESKNGFTDACNKLKIKGEDDIFYSVIE